MGYRFSIDLGRRGRVVVTPQDNCQGLKGRASRLAEACNGRWSHRAHGYVLSSRKRLDLFRQLYAAGWDGGWNGGLQLPDGSDWPHNENGPNYSTRVAKFPTLAEVQGRAAA